MVNDFLTRRGAQGRREGQAHGGVPNGRIGVSDETVEIVVLMEEIGGRKGENMVHFELEEGLKIRKPAGREA